MSRGRHYSAFSLIELVLSLMVLAILASIGIVSYSNSYRQNVLKTTAEEIVSLIRLAQQESISQRQGNVWGVRFDNTNPSAGFVAVFSNTYAPANLVERYSLPFQVRFQTPPVGSYQEIIFQKLTGLPNATATVELILAGSSQTRVISINSLGGVTEE